VRGVELAISAAELVALLGSSGCGKTTLLRIFSGFISQSEGRIQLDGEPVDALPPNRRNVGIVFQKYALFPHMSVWEIVIYGLAARGTPRELTRARLEAMLRIVHLGALADRYPRHLSSGQQQRVAVAKRARRPAWRPTIKSVDTSAMLRAHSVAKRTSSEPSRYVQASRPGCPLVYSRTPNS
jgi:putative spermidine/putrescine transport system ATP-binding protein